MQTRFFRIARLVFVFIALISSSSILLAQSQSEVLSELSKRTGLSQEELLKRYQEGTLPSLEGRAPDTTVAPGRTHLPPEVPAVVLPLSEAPPASETTI